jgi:prepilin-type N-terminal cleavage/methylation domain-containing protein
MKSRGLSLIEVLAVAAIIGVLIALLLPAVQSAREAARRTQCASHLRQLGLALHAYEAAYRVLPQFAQNNYSFHVALLPFLEQQALYDDFDLSLNAMDYRGPRVTFRVAVFECPSDASRTRVPFLPAATHYHGNWGTGALRYGNNGIFSYDNFHPRYVQCLPFSAITDGLSQTTMLAEVIASDDTLHSRSILWSVPPVRPEQFEQFEVTCRQAPSVSSRQPFQRISRGRPWLESGMNWNIYNHILTPNQPSCSNGRSLLTGAYSSSSFHGSAVTTAMADGSVQIVSESIDLGVWRQRGSRAGDP